MRPLEGRLALDAPRPYAGCELAAHFLRATFGVSGDAAVLWRGPACVATTELVDLVDHEAGATIASDEMVHLMVESFACPLETMIAFQRLAAALLADRVRSASAAARERGVVRSGDDVYVGGRKLSVSIATASPISSLLHFGVNVLPTGAPLPVASLQELEIEAETLAGGWLEDLESEWLGLLDARAKVRSVGEWLNPHISPPRAAEPSGERP